MVFASLGCLDAWSHAVAQGHSNWTCEQGERQRLEEDGARKERGLGLLEVIIAITLFMVMLVPAAEFLVGGVKVTGVQRAKAIATQLAAQQPSEASSVETISGIRFSIDPKTYPPVCQKLNNGDHTIEVPVEKIIVTVKWGANQSYSVSRWKPSTSTTCPVPSTGTQP